MEGMGVVYILVSLKIVSYVVGSNYWNYYFLDGLESPTEHCCLGDLLGDNATLLYRDYNKPL